MSKRSLFTPLLLLGIAGTAIGEGGILLLPKQKTRGSISLEETIAKRRTCREFQAKPLPLEDLAQLLWAAQGITGSDGTLRAAPSGGALYPLDVYVVVGETSVEGLEAGAYRYVPSQHGLEQAASGDLRRAVAQASLGQTWMADAPVSLVDRKEIRVARPPIRNDRSRPRGGEHLPASRGPRPCCRYRRRL
jgi:nitroreductase